MSGDPATDPRRYLCLARVTIEFESPLRIGTGVEDERLGHTVLRDHRGLPIIPGTSIAGTIKARLTPAPAWFGDGEKGDEAMHALSAVDITHALPLDASGHAVHPTAPLTEPDEVLRALRAHHERNHVRLNARGSAASRTFRTSPLVLTGARFVFDLQVSGPTREEAEARLDLLLAALDHPWTTLGGGGAEGHGEFRIHDIQAAAFDLTLSRQKRGVGGLAEYGAWPTSLSDALPPIAKSTTAPQDPPEGIEAPPVRIQLQLEARDFAYVGGGDTSLSSVPHLDKPPHIAPWREPRISWVNGTGSVTVPEAVFPGSAIRGALRHRTVFHLNRLLGVWADPSHDKPITHLHQHDAFRNKALWPLFGGLELADGEEDPRAGRIRVLDAWPENTVVAHQHHVTIDRFTGGAYDRHLYVEEVLGGRPMRLTIELRVHDPGNEVPSELRQAFALALEDLREGRLALGSGEGHGHGRFEHRHETWSDEKAWLDGPPTRRGKVA